MLRDFLKKHTKKKGTKNKKGIIYLLSSSKSNVRKVCSITTVKLRPYAEYTKQEFDKYLNSIVYKP